MATTESILERVGGGGVLGLAVAAVAVGSLPAVRRGLRSLAKAAIVEYLRLTGSRAGVGSGLNGAAAVPASVAAPPRRRRAQNGATPPDEAAPATPRATRRSRTAATAAVSDATAAAPPSRAPRQPRAESADQAAEPAEEAAPSRRPRRTRAGAAEPGAAAEPSTAGPEGAEAPAAEPEPARRGRRGAEDGEPDDGLVNLNTASRSQLLRLPRIGAQTADRIIEFRDNQGPIRSLRQLRQADVIPVAAWRQLRDQVRF
jgi:competence protein ComEA